MYMGLIATMGTIIENQGFEQRDQGGHEEKIKNVFLLELLIAL